MPIRATLKVYSYRKTKKGYPIKIYVTGYGKEKPIPLNRFTEEKSISEIKGNLKRKLAEREVNLMKEVDYCNDNNLSFSDSLEVISNGITDKTIQIAVLEEQLRKLKGDTGARLFDFWDEFKADLIAQGKSTKAYDDARSEFEKFTGTNIRINDISYELLKKFKTKKYYDGAKDGGIATYLRKIKTVFLEAQRMESLGVKSGNPFKGVIPEAVGSKIVELSRDELNKIKEFEPSKFSSPKNAAVMIRRRDIWLFQLYIGGHDFIDVALLENSNIKNGRIRFRRYKNRSKKDGGPLVDNIIIPEAMAIIKKHGNKNGRLFPFITDPHHETAYEGYRRNTNRALKKISEQCGLENVMKTKSPRYIFKTWAGEAQCDFLTTKQVQGQKIPDVSMRYQAALSHDLVDEVIRKTIYR